MTKRGRRQYWKVRDRLRPGRNFWSGLVIVLSPQTGLRMENIRMERIDVAAAVITPIILKMLGNHKVTDVPIGLPYVDERSPIESIIASPVNFKLHHRATPLIASAPKSAESFLTLNWIDIGLNGGTVFVKPDRAKLAEEFFSGISPHIDGEPAKNSKRGNRAQGDASGAPTQGCTGLARWR